MFKGKVYVYRNNNGKEEEFEKEFDNPQDFNNFAYRQPEFKGPFMGLGDWAHLQNYFNNLIDRRFGLGTMPEPEEDQKSLPSSINFDEYESELQKMKYEEAHKNEKIQRLKDDIARLKELKGEFEARGRDDMVKKINKDISSTQKELDALEK